MRTVYLRVALVLSDDASAEDRVSLAADLQGVIEVGLEGRPEDILPGLDSWRVEVPVLAS